LRLVVISGSALCANIQFGAIALAQNIKPEPIALPPSEFPTPSAEIEAQIARDDTVGLRKHAWTLWQGLTADSSQSLDARGLPIWETWLSDQEAFSPVARLAALTNRLRILLPLAPPHQFQHGAPALRRALTLGATPSQRLLAGVKISPDSASFLAAPHETPANSGQSYSYVSASDLAQLNAAFDQSHAAVKDRKIVDFPAAATDLKVVFMPVNPTGLSPIPLWNGAADSIDPTQPIPSSWKTCVAVDPTSSRTGTASINCNGQQVDAEIVPLKAFYSVQLDEREAATINSLSKLAGSAAVKAGDFHVLVAMHVTTKEIANWTWETFWWQNGKNPPNSFPGSVDDMPDASKVKVPGAITPCASAIRWWSRRPTRKASRSSVSIPTSKPTRLTVSIPTARPATPWRASRLRTAPSTSIPRPICPTILWISEIPRFSPEKPRQTSCGRFRNLPIEPCATPGGCADGNHSLELVRGCSAISEPGRDRQP
jgi:hypothetical protein